MKTHIINFCIKSIFIFLFCFFINSVNLFADYNWMEIKKITASDAVPGGHFGLSVAIDGNIAIVGAPAYTANPTLGAAYIFERNSGSLNGWGEVKKLISTDLENNDKFGAAVAIAGDFAIVGAFGEGSNGQDAGAAYIFERNQGGANAWGQVKKLTASDALEFSEFGASVAIANNMAFVGAPKESTSASSAGAAYVFERNEGGANNWGEIQKLTAYNAMAAEYFGSSIDVDGNGLIVGGMYRAYIFGCNNNYPTNWSVIKQLLPSNLGSYRCCAAIAGDVAIIGSPEIFNGSKAGAAFVFERNEGGNNNWGETKKLTASNPIGLEYFGKSVALSTSGVAIIGSPNSSSFAQKAYVFERNSGWGETKKLTANNPGAHDDFGCSVDISGDMIIVGAYKESSRSSWAGAAYIFGTIGSLPSETFNNAPDLSDNSGLAEGNNSDATTESGEPQHAGNGGPYHSVWWNWAETTDALMLKKVSGTELQIDTHGSDFDTVLAVYTGSAVNNLTQIAANDNAEAGVETSELSFQFNSGVTYHIVVDGKTVSDTGNVVLNYAVIPEPFFIIILLIPPFLKGVRGI